MTVKSNLTDSDSDADCSDTCLIRLHLWHIRCCGRRRTTEIGLEINEHSRGHILRNTGGAPAAHDPLCDHWVWLLSIMFCKTLLIERIDLEKDMMKMCPRFAIFLAITTLLSMSLLGADITERGAINKLLMHSFNLDDLADGMRSTEDVRDFMHSFANTASTFYPVNSKYVPDPEHIKITTGLKQYQEGRTLPSDLRPRIRTSFTLTSWVASKVETWIVRTEPRGVQMSSGLQTCWAWRYPAELVYGSHDMAIDMPSSRTPLSIVKSASPVPDVLDTYTMEAVVVNDTHATFYRDAHLLGTYPPSLRAQRVSHSLTIKTEATLRLHEALLT